MGKEKRAGQRTRERGERRAKDEQRERERTRRMEKEPWYTRVEGPFPEWQGPVGVKADGGGSTYAQGKVGNMVMHRAVNNRNIAAIKKAIEDGVNLNKVKDFFEKECWAHHPKPHQSYVE